MFTKKRVYLAGPITGLSYNEARYGWRKDFIEALQARGADHIECFSPMREKEFLENAQCISGDPIYDSLQNFGTPSGILTRDHNDVKECDLMVANFLGAKAPSIGTCVEVGFAYAYRKPLILIMEPRAPEMAPVERKIERISRLDYLHGQSAVYDELAKRGYVEAIIASDVEDPATQDHILIVNGTKKTGGFVKNPHDHLFLRACAGYTVPTLENALDITQSLLTPGL